MHKFIAFLKKKEEKKIKDFLRDMCRTAVDAEALWKRRPTKPISGKVPYYLFFLSFFFYKSLYMSIVLLTETQGLLQQPQNDLVVWSEALSD